MVEQTEQKKLSKVEVAKHNTKESTWLIIKDSGDSDKPKVYDVTTYLDDHPGGAEVMLEVAGEDATNMFEDIGHSSDARKEMMKYQIGVLELTEDEEAKLAEETAKKAQRQHREGGGLNPLAVLFLLLAIAIGYYYSQKRE